MAIAVMICGTELNRKMLKVLNSEFQNSGSVSSRAKLAKPTHSPGPVRRFQLFRETTKV